MPLFGVNSCEWVLAYYGITKTGAVLNPLSSMLTTDQLGYTVTDAGARIVIGAADKAGELLELKAAGAIDHVVLWGAAAAEGATALSDWLARDVGRFETRPRDPADLAVIACTSGTTGRPKGAMQSQRAAYKLPRAVQFVSAVPMTASGTIMRRMLKTLDDGGRTGDQAARGVSQGRGITP